MKHLTLSILACIITSIVLSQVNKQFDVIKSEITSFEISDDNNFIYIVDASKNTYYYDVKQRVFIPKPAIPNFPRFLNQSNQFSSNHGYQFYLPQKEKKAFSAVQQDNSLLIVNATGATIKSFALKSNDYRLSYSNTGRYLLVIQQDVFYNKSDAGAKVIDLETGKVLIDKFSYIKNQKLLDSINKGLPNPLTPHDKTLVKYGDNKFSRDMDTIFYEYQTKDGHKGVYKSFTPFQPDFGEFDKTDSKLILTGSNAFVVLDVKTGRQLLTVKMKTQLSRFLHDGNTIVSATGNQLVFYDAIKRAAVFSTSKTANNREPFNIKDMIGEINVDKAFTVVSENMKQNPKALKMFQDSINQMKKVLAGIPNADRLIDSTLTVLSESEELQNHLPAMITQSGSTVPPDEVANTYYKITSAEFNQAGTYLIIGYSAFEDDHINNINIDYTENKTYYNVINLNTGRRVENVDWNKGQIKHAAFNREGTLAMIEYGNKTSPFSMTERSLIEILRLDTESSQVISSISNSELTKAVDHNVIFSEDGKYIVITNNWRYEESLKTELYTVDGVLKSKCTIPINHIDENNAILFLPGANTIFMYHKGQRLFSIYDFSGKTLLPEYHVNTEAREASLLLSKGEEYIYIYKTAGMSNEPYCFTWDLRKNILTPVQGIAGTNIADTIQDKSGKYSLVKDGGQVMIFDQNKSFVNKFALSNYDNSPECANFSVLNNELYFTINDKLRNEFDFYSVENFRDKKNNIKNLRSKKKIVAANITRQVFVSADNGLLTFFNARSGKPVYYFEMFDEHDYFIWDTSGYYMSSSNKIVKHFKGMEKIDLEKNRPDIILKLIGSSDSILLANLDSARKIRVERNKEAGATETSQNKTTGSKPIARLKPISQSVVVHQQDFAIRLYAVDAKYKLAKVRVWIKNIPLWGINGLAINDSQSRFFDKTVHIKLSEGENTIEFEAQNENGERSNREVVRINYNPDLETKPVIHFVGAGISRYNNRFLADLNFADKDITDVAHMFKSKFPTSIIQTFLNEQATSKNLLKAKQQLLSSGIEDIVILYLSGHGTIDTSGIWHFATYDYNMPNGKRGLRFEEIESLLDSIPARKRLLIIDACYSGEIPQKYIAKKGSSQIEKTSDSNSHDDELRYTAVKKGEALAIDTSFEIFQLMFDSFGELSKGVGEHIIASSQGNQKSAENQEFKQGLMTHFLLKRLNEYNHSGTKRPLSIVELREYIINETSRASEGAQRPVARRENYEFNWTIWQ